MLLMAYLFQNRLDMFRPVNLFQYVYCSNCTRDEVFRYVFNLIRRSFIFGVAYLIDCDSELRKRIAKISG